MSDLLPATQPTATLMDGIYRYQRHIYDVSRRYYLLGRDRMIAELDVPAGGSVLEVGCGTARNLVAIARAYPNAQVYGIDISTEMLKSAEANVRRAGNAWYEREAVMLTWPAYQSEVTLGSYVTFNE